MLGVYKRYVHNDILKNTKVSIFTRFSSTKVPKSDGKNTQKITEESDFAFRKTSISELPFVEQDKKYYPTIGECITKLKENVTHDIVKLRIPEYRKKYFGIVNSENLLQFEKDPKYILTGKIKSIRKAGKGSIFMDIIQDYEKVQLIVHHKIMNIEKTEFLTLHSNFRPGDQVIALGNVGVTKVGELSLKLIKPLILASPALHPLPPKFNDIGKVNSNRVIDYLVNKESKDLILLRSRIIQLIRMFFESRDFINMETPIICNGNSGANATPFETSSQHINANVKGGDSDNNKREEYKLNLRVAPELWLKRLIISGFDKIYEIGKSFRNEGIDSTHNPEFTTCEFYQTFIGLDELMKISEDLIINILEEILKDGRFVIFHKNCQDIMNSIRENGCQFRRVEFLSELENQTGVKLSPSDLNEKGLLKYFEKIGKPITGERRFSSTELINQLSEDYLEPLCAENVPTFIYNIPEIVSPLSKSGADGISKRFEMYINGMEYMNAYEEENNPFKQKFKFELQNKNRVEFSDQESLIPDYRYVEFMEWGMPPTGGWGMGIDRLVMKIGGVGRIENVLPFGKLNDVVKQ